MTARTIFGSLFVVLALALGICALFARFSRKSHNRSAGLLLAALIPPVLGNMIITLSGDQALATAGCMIYYVGMTVLMFALLRFTFDYCRLNWPSRWLQVLVYALLVIDIIQLLLNPLFHHAFTTTEIPDLDGYAYYQLVPGLGQTFHRIVDYGVFFAALLVFIYQTARAPRLSKERYAIILVSMIIGGLWQTYNIFNGIAIDLSMIGFAVFGLMVFYFSVFYRPVRLLERMLSGIASNSANALFFYDSEGICIWANQQAMDMAAKLGQDYTGAASWLLEHFPCVSRPGANWTENHTLGSGEDTRFYSIRKQYLTEGHSGIAGSFITVQDHTEEQREVARQLYIARHDRLTGLYTRDYLYEETRNLIDQHPDTDFVIGYADFNDFKLINDLYGSDFGDAVLCQFATFMRENLSGKTSTFGRLGGDTFGVCQPVGSLDPEWLSGMLNGFQVSDNTVEHRVHIHVGLYTVTDRSLDVSVMYDRAHLALLSIKDNYQRNLAYYKDEMRASILWNQRISSELPGAIATRQIRPFLQPMVDRDGKIIGAEALARWIHPSEGMLSPASFIPLLEKNGMIAEVDRHIWRCACEILSRWKQEGRDEFISINISPKDFALLDIPTELKGLVNEFGIDPARLRVEITESVMLVESENPLAILKELREAGFIIEMDDFGSGYSSLNMLKDMPVDILKIDMVFLRKSADTARNRIIVRHIISMAKDLGITSVTEGVETEAQYHALKEMGCEIFQGYYFSKPIPVEEFEVKL